MTYYFKNKKGFSLVEMLIAIAIFSVIMSAIYTAFSIQVKHTSREYKVAEAEVEVGIAKNIIERELAMAGYGLADDYDYDGDGVQNFTPAAAQATNADPDTLTLMGTGLGLKSRQSQGWTYIKAETPEFEAWGDAREDLSNGDRVILVEPNSKKLLAEQVSGTWRWLFQYNGTASNVTTLPTGGTLTNTSKGTLVYGLYGSGDTAATQPFYAVRYYIKDNSSATDPSNCATPKTGANRVNSLLRAEDRTTMTPDGGDSILSCVRDFQVAFGLDTDENGTIDIWDNGGVQAAGYDAKSLNKRLKQIRAYVLLQSGNKDLDYTSPATIRVGDESLSIGRVVTLTTEQRNYRWRVLSMSITPRNIRK